MPNQPRIEELSDSASDSDPPEDDLDDFAPTAVAGFTDPALRAAAAAAAPSRTSTLPASSQTREILQPQNPVRSSQNGDGYLNSQAPPPTYKTYACLYPVYFDAGRSRAEGRRVKKSQAVRNPLAREIVDAVQTLGLKVVFEPGKCHPKDWSNPGRVRVGLNEGGGSKVKNKHHLYILVSNYLLAHPTTKETPLRLRIQGLPLPDGPIPAPAVPKGYKINKILPLHSPALSGGGISENILGDIMKEMQDGGETANPMASMLAGLGGGSASVANSEAVDSGSKKKRDKKKK